MSASVTLKSQIQHEMVVAGGSNMVFNGIIAWLLLRSGSNLTLTGEHSYAMDVLATAFILPFIVTLIVIPLNQRKLAKGETQAISLDGNHWLQGFMAHFPDKLWLRALGIGTLSMLIFTPLTLLPLWALGLHEFTPLGYSIFKGVWAGLVAVALVYPLLLLALREGQSGREASAAATASES